MGLVKTCTRPARGGTIEWQNFMIKRVRWGILGAAKIAVRDVIPAMQMSENCEIYAIASRNAEKAKISADELKIPKYYGSYEELLADPEIEAVYIPLPNHLHVEWAIKAARAGKHSLCEKPIGLNAPEVRKLIEIRDQTGVKIQEAFMVRTHPKWLAVRDLIREERIGKLEAITGFFSYFNDDVSNIRNRREMGGGGLLDIGCYCVNISRFILGAEPANVLGFIKRDDNTGIDKLTSAILDFPNALATFTCSTQIVPYQRMQFFGTKGRLEVQIPFNIPSAAPTRIFIDDGTNLYGESIEITEFEASNKFTIQGDLFSRAISTRTEQAISLEDSFKNMAVIDAIFRSVETGKWELPETL